MSDVNVRVVPAPLRDPAYAYGTVQLSFSPREGCLWAPMSATEGDSVDIFATINGTEVDLGRLKIMRVDQQIPGPGSYFSDHSITTPQYADISRTLQDALVQIDTRNYGHAKAYIEEARSKLRQIPVRP